MMKYRKLALLVSLAVSLHGTCYATTVAGVASNEGEQNSVTLLHDSDGGTGQILVTNSGGSAVLNTSQSQIQISGSTQPPVPPVALSPTQINSLYEQAISSRPPSPQPSQSTPAAPPTTTGQSGSTAPTSGNSAAGIGTGAGTGGTVGLSTLQALIGLTQGVNAISASPSTPSQTGGFSPLATFAPPPPVAQSPVAQPLPSATVSPPATENHSTDQILSTVTTQAGQTPAAAAQYFFAKGKDAVLSEGTFNTIGESPYLVWGLWGMPLQKAPFTQSYGIVYSSDQLATPTTLTSLQQQQVTASYQGSLQGTVAYGSTTTGITVNDLAMSVNFGSQTLTFSGANGSLAGHGSFTASAPTVTGSLSYNGALNNSASANLSGNFHGAFLGSAAEELGAAWAMTGKVNGTTATGAGIVVASQAT